MDVVQGQIHDHLTIMPPVLQIISSISVVIWPERVQSWMFNSATVGLAFLSPFFPILHFYPHVAMALSCVYLALNTVFWH